VGKLGIRCDQAAFETRRKVALQSLIFMFAMLATCALLAGMAVVFRIQRRSAPRRNANCVPRKTMAGEYCQPTRQSAFFALHAFVPLFCAEPPRHRLTLKPY